MFSSIPPDVNPIGRYSIKETCLFLGICRDTLRKYTCEGLIRCGFRKHNYSKFYLGSEIMRFWEENTL